MGQSSITEKVSNTYLDYSPILIKYAPSDDQHLYMYISIVRNHAANQKVMKACPSVEIMQADGSSSVHSKRLEGKVALVTGGARGIGKCIAKHYCKHGSKVVIADILDAVGLAVAEELGQEVALFVHCDVSVEKDVENAVNAAISKFGKLDVMVNNAATGDPHQRSILDSELAEFERVLKVNLTGCFLGTKHAARVMVPKRKGSIISIGSVSSSVGGVATHAYTSAKHGIVGLAKNVAAELGRFGIRVNCLSPYFIPTQGFNDFFNLEDEVVQGIYSNLEGVKLTEDDVAEAAVYLGSDESKYMSGHNMSLDGGFTTINPAFGLYARFN